jgi:hypothetical protein
VSLRRHRSLPSRATRIEIDINAPGWSKWRAIALRDGDNVDKGALKEFLREFERPAEASPALAVWDRLNEIRDQLDLTVCYGSVFDDCWTTRARAYTQATEPARSWPQRARARFRRLRLDSPE